MSETESGRESLLIDALVGLADTLVDDYDIVDLFDRLIDHCVRLRVAEDAGILLADAHGDLQVMASTSEQSDWLELLQLQTDEGPCVECVRTGVPVSIADLADETTRWPRLVAAMRGREAYRSVHALPLRLRGEAIGALNLFQRRPGTLPTMDLALGQALADMATIGILQERAVRRSEVVTEQLQVALNSRVIIEQAKGFLAHRGDLSLNEAFQRLRRYARDRNLRISEVARQVVETDLGADVLATKAARHPTRQSR